jgi:deazaflavin-dependent oxidoreductase (nitroreductase family)
MSEPIDLAALGSQRTIDLTTKGRRSGLQRRIEIWWFRVDDRFFITGTPGARDWYANVIADPRVVIHVAGRDFPARAIPVRDPVLRARVFDDPQTRWYGTQSQRQRLIDDAPMVEVEFDL